MASRIPTLDELPQVREAMDFSYQNVTLPALTVLQTAAEMFPGQVPIMMSPIHRKINMNARRRPISETTQQLASEAGLPTSKYTLLPEKMPRYDLPEEEARRIAQLPRLQRAEELGWGEKIHGQIKNRSIDPQYQALTKQIDDLTSLYHSPEGADQRYRIGVQIKQLEQQKSGIQQKPPTTEVPNEWFHSTANTPLQGVGLTRSKLGSNTGAASAKKAFWFASEPEVSSSYIENKVAMSADKRWDLIDKKTQIEKRLDELFDRGLQKSKEYETLSRKLKFIEAEYAAGTAELPAGTMMKSRLRMKNPYIYDSGGKQRYEEQHYNDLVKKAKAGGHDGLIILNTYDPGGGAGGKKLTNIAAVWNENQVRVPHAKFNPYSVGSGDVLKTAFPLLITAGALSKTQPILDDLDKQLKELHATKGL